VGGLEGSYITLDEAEEIVLGHSDYSDAINNRYPVTVLILHPRISTTKKGDVMVSLSDIEFLRGIVRNTLEAIQDGQERNI
jgi:hypothetical protein